MIYILAILYCLIGAAFHYGILKEYANDMSESTKDIPVGYFKAVAFMMSLLWPLTLAWAFIEHFIKKEDNE